MIKQALALLLLVASLSACARDNPPPAAASAPATAAAPAAGPAPASGNKPVGDLAAAAATQQEGADISATVSGQTDSGEAQLERIAALPPEGQLPAGKWVPGTNYKIIAPAQPTNVAPGKVEVIEMFWYGCPHCFAIDPVIESWRKNKAAYVEFVRVPVTWADVHRAHAHLFYTLQALGKLEALHSKVFAQIHQDHDMLFVPNDPLATQRAQLAFAKDNGISEADFMKAYNSFAVQTNLQEADDLVRRYRIDSVPTFVIAGKYETDMAQAGGETNLLQLINDLAASEKRH
jgi:protein dithiol oxidoreductase (disulfide-forming)